MKAMTLNESCRGFRLTKNVSEAGPLVQQYKKGINRSRQQQGIPHPSFHNRRNSSKRAEEKHNILAATPAFGPPQASAPSAPAFHDSAFVA
jgi:hypothetical protein